MERDAFLARLRRGRPGPDLPAIDPLPLVQTEARAGEDLYERFRSELEAVDGLCEIVSPGREGLVVGAFLQSAGVKRAGLGADLGEHRDVVASTLATLGVETVPYAEIADDRAAVGALDATVTGCAALVAATGSLVTTATVGRAAALIAPVHVCVARRSQLVGGLSDVLASMPAGSMVALQSGPSRTADIEKRLILGMHGPASTLVVVVRD
jgi:L-lactate utilization protein LutC